VLATVSVPGRTALRVAGIHLSLHLAERLQQVEDLIARLRTTRLPLVVAGDLNEPPGGTAWRALSAVVRDPAPRAGVTYSTARPRHRIDAVLTSPDVETLEYGEWHPSDRDARLASDHLPVLAVLRLRQSE
jgi:endonuclease/exonuclease/phosphatase family metal-dependent hydrolase